MLTFFPHKTAGWPASWMNTIHYNLHRSKWYSCGSQNHIEGSRPEWCTSSMIYSRYTPFWSETLDIQYWSERKWKWGLSDQAAAKNSHPLRQLRRYRDTSTQDQGNKKKHYLNAVSEHKEGQEVTPAVQSVHNIYPGDKTAMWWEEVCLKKKKHGLSDNVSSSPFSFQYSQRGL